jgi:F0F1-type ATP synthase membrane subunit b/b'
MTRLEREVAEIRRQGEADGENARTGLVERAREEAERIRKDSEEEITRRVAAAKADLQQTAAGLMASTAREIVVREITDDDRRRLLSESVERLKGAR